MTEAEKEKLEIARKDAEEKEKKDAEEKARKDAEEKARKDAEEQAREDKRRKDSEEIPVWADSLIKRMDALEKRDTANAEDPTENSEGKVIKDAQPAETDDSRKDAEAKEAAERKAKEEREDRARKDAAQSLSNRDTAAKIAQMEAQIKAVYSEPSMEDRNAIAEVRFRADSVYQAVLGRPVPDAIPGESPISYRKRLADGLKKFSTMYATERLDSLSGNVFTGVEDRIYADAVAAAKTPAVVPAGQLRAITRNDSGHTITEYVGDPSATWAPFQMGAGAIVTLNNPKH